jgi:tight adherence protein C
VGSDATFMTTLIGVIVAGCSAWLLYVALTTWRVRGRTLTRLFRVDDEPGAAMGVEPPVADGWLARWLLLAGYRRPGAPAFFVLACGASLLAGVALSQALRLLVLPDMIGVVLGIPGGVGEALAAILQAGPAIVLIIMLLVPVLLVRAARRNRVRDVEQHLPLVLELLATLAEAGLSFDAALTRIVRSERAMGPLTAEFVTFQRDLLAGMPRLQALRQLARRVDVTALTIFVSAVIQTEQVGASVAETLRHQANDLRDRRRERALMLAQALPVRLVFPLVACFLPGIFVSTLGPVIYQMIQVADSVMRPVGR